MWRSLLSLTLAVLCVHSFDVTDTGSSFTVSVKSKVLLQHTKSSPLVFAGNGNIKVSEDSGNYFFKTRTESRVPLSNYNLTNKGTFWQVVLEQGAYSVTLKISNSTKDDVEIDFESISDGLNFFWLRLPAEKDEKVFGGGEQYSFLNLRERDENRPNTYPIWVSEQGVGRNKRTIATFLADTQGGDSGGNYHTTYFPQPTFVSSENYFFHHDGANYGILDFNSDNFHEFFVYGQPGKFTLSVADSFADTVSTLSNFIGHMPELPDWIQERAVVSCQGGTATLKAKLNLAKSNNIPVSAIWIQDWSGQVSTDFGTRVNWDWKWSQKLYPGLDKLIKEWKKEGVRILGYINPNLNVNGVLFKEAASKGYLVKNSTGDPYLRNSISLIFGQVDLTNPTAYEWYKNVIKTNMIGLGLGGWMADFGEYLAVDAILHDKRSGMEVHNEWPALWAKLNREALEETKTLGKIIFFTRGGFTGTSKYSTLIFDGDQNVDFSYDDGVRSTIYASVGSGMNGVTFSHFDIGGYTTVGAFGMVRTEELLLRSAEYAVFSPVFRTHDGNQIENNAQWYDVDTGLTAKFAVQANNFAKLAPYRKAVGRDSVQSGLPVMRLTSLVFPNDPQPLEYDQYMFGTDILVAPVYDAGVDKRTVTFPQLPSGEKWVNIWTCEETEGNQRLSVSAPLSNPPVFYRSGTQFISTFKQLRNQPTDSDSRPNKTDAKEEL